MKELSSMIVSSPFYEQKMRLSSILSHQMECWFGLYFMQLESKMRVLKIWIPSVNSVGCGFYPQNELLNGFCQFD